MPHRATRFLTHPYKCPGVWGAVPSFLKSYLNSFAKSSPITCPSPLFSPFLFMCLRTLSFSVSCKSFACHSYENCRVCTNNSHFGTRWLPRAVRGLSPTSHQSRFFPCYTIRFILGEPHADPRRRLETALRVHRFREPAQTHACRRSLCPRLRPQSRRR